MHWWYLIETLCLPYGQFKIIQQASDTCHRLNVDKRLNTYLLVDQIIGIIFWVDLTITKHDRGQRVRQRLGPLFIEGPSGSQRHC